MKSRFLKITFAAALAVVAGVTAYQAQDKEVMSDLAWPTWKRWQVVN